MNETKQSLRRKRWNPLKFITEKDVREAFDTLKSKARQGDRIAAETLISFGVGLPRPQDAEGMTGQGGTAVKLVINLPAKFGDDLVEAEIKRRLAKAVETQAVAVDQEATSKPAEVAALGQGAPGASVPAKGKPRGKMPPTRAGRFIKVNLPKPEEGGGGGPAGDVLDLSDGGADGADGGAGAGG